MKNKRGQGLSTNAIILIILGVVILVVLIFGFTMGWNTLFPFLKPSNNVANVVNICGTACSQNAKYDFCSSKRELVADDVTLKDVTCYYLALHQTQYGVVKCDKVTCDMPANTVLVKDLAAAKTQCAPHKTVDAKKANSVQYLKEKTLVTETCDKVPAPTTP